MLTGWKVFFPALTERGSVQPELFPVPTLRCGDYTAQTHTWQEIISLLRRAKVHSAAMEICWTGSVWTHCETTLLFFSFFFFYMNVSRVRWMDWRQSYNRQHLQISTLITAQRICPAIVCGLSTPEFPSRIHRRGFKSPPFGATNWENWRSCCA